DGGRRGQAGAQRRAGPGAGAPGRWQGRQLSRRRHAHAHLRIHALEARQFRNLENVLMEPHPRFNVLSGDNGQGKTNVLEAIYLLGTLRSFRAGKTEELARFGAEQASVQARGEKLRTTRL